MKRNKDVKVKGENKEKEQKTSFINRIPEMISSTFKKAKDIDIDKVKGMDKSETFEKIKTYAKNRGSNDGKIKREFKQIEKGAIMIVCSVVVGYMIFSWFYVPTKDDFSKKEITYAESNRKRNIIQQQVEGKAQTEKKIKEITKEMKAVKGRYPNVRTQNECIFILSQIIESHGVTPSQISVGLVTPFNKADIANSIAQKSINSKLSVEAAQYFTATNTTDDKNTTGTENGETTPPEGTNAENTSFEYLLLDISVENLTKSRAYAIIESIKKEPRIIITESIQVTSNDEDDSYTISGHFYFYAYREDRLEDLFN